MKKIFLLIPLLAFAMMANAKVWEIDPCYNPDWSSSSQNIEHTIGSNINDGDTIVLRHGIYVEPYSININHPVVIMADENAKPIIQRGSYFGVYANVKFIGIKFDGGNTAEYAAYVQNGTTKSIIFEDCEFTGFTKDIITGSSSKSNLDSCVINNCYFHDNVRSAVKFETSSSRTDGLLSCNFLKVTNSTITNVSALSGALIDNRNNANESGTDSLYVDHVTIYNWTGGSNGAIMAYKSHRVEITNCIIAEPSNSSLYGVYCYGGAVKNCLINNATHRKWDNYPTFTGELTGDPLFVDATAGNYKLADLSPARNAGTDGSNLGDPRWNTTSLPQTDFATPYVFTGAKAAISGNIWRNDSKYLYGNGGSKEVYGTAEWWIHATRACAIQVALNMDPDALASGHIFKVEIFDDQDTKKGEVAESGYSSSKVDGIVLPGTIYIPKAGDYRIKLSNTQTYSSAVIKGITLSYVGGAVQNMPGTTNLADAWFSNNGTRADGKISYSSINDGCWAKWNINVAAAGNFNVTVNISGQYGHDYSVEFLKEGETTPIVVTKNATNYTNDATLYANELGSVILEAANYEMTVSNAVGDAALHSVKLSYAGGGTVALPATLQPMDAVLEQWEVAEGKISGTEGNATTGSALWNVSNNGGQYKFKLNYTSDNGHLMKVEIFEEGSQTAKYTWNESSTTQWSTGDFEADLGTFELEDKDYVIKVTNTQPNSHAKVTNIVATYLGGAVVNLPGTLPLADALLSDNAYRNDGATELHFIAPENVEFIANEYAIWNVQATAGLYDFTLNVVGTNYGIYQIIVKDSENNVKFTGSKGKSASGSVTISNVLIAADGNYTIQIANINNYADGYLTGVSAEKQDNVVILDENATTNDVLTDPEVYNQSKKIALNRTFKGGMYNTICLPFEIGSQGTMESVFGVGYELLQLNDATLSDGGVLNLSFDPVTTLERGVPYLIRPAADVINPVISSRKIKSTSVPDYTRGVVDFVGTYIMGTIPASESNLFLGPNNTLYFPTGDTPIKGLRAWFRVNVPGANQVIKRANIVTQGQVITEIDLVNEPNNGAVKTLENGQLIIIKNGVRYNGLGIMIK